MNQYRKKPVVIEAWQNSDENEFPSWVDSADVGREPGGVILINTLEGVMKAMPGDYIIKGVQGEIYPCKPDIFEATYDSVPKNHIERMEIEASELQAKIDGAQKFLDSFQEEAAPLICDEQFDLIEKQLKFMKAYLITLRRRIKFDKEMFNDIGVKPELKQDELESILFDGSKESAMKILELSDKAYDDGHNAFQINTKTGELTLYTSRGSKSSKAGTYWDYDPSTQDIYPIVNEASKD